MSFGKRTHKFLGSLTLERATYNYPWSQNDERISIATLSRVISGPPREYDRKIKKILFELEGSDLFVGLTKAKEKIEELRKTHEYFMARVRASGNNSLPKNC